VNGIQTLQRIKLRVMKSTKPLPETLRSLMEMSEIGTNELGRRCQAKGWGSPSAISLVTQGQLKPSLAAIEGLARGLGVEPETFAEYRLGMARRKLDPDVVGLHAALRELERIS
jgi:transcriptional regulator with XRE-family HTH domain